MKKKNKKKDSYVYQATLELLAAGQPLFAGVLFSLVLQLGLHFRHPSRASSESNTKPLAPPPFVAMPKRSPNEKQ